MLKKEHEARLQITQDMQSRAVGTCVGQVGNSPLILASVEAKPKTSKILGLLLAPQGFQTFLRPCKGLELHLDRPFPLGLSDGCTYIAYPTTCTCCLQAKVLWNRINQSQGIFSLYGFLFEPSKDIELAIGLVSFENLI